MVLSIPEFFAHKNVFITGGLGFMGKVLIEKLLRSCPQIGCIYLLVRSKRQQNPDERLKQLTDTPLFQLLLEKHPEAFKKLKVVVGDVMELELGLSKEDKELLLENVNIVYHMAASVRFNDHLKAAILMNTRGAREIASLALQMKKLEVFVHVSTAYSHCDNKIVEERLYPPHTDWRSCIKVAEETDEYLLNALMIKYIDKLPNTYTFTKALAENVVYDMCNGQIPNIIIRPSIVISTLEEPIEGWCDNFNGPVGICYAVGSGKITYVIFLLVVGKEAPEKGPGKKIPWIKLLRKKSTLEERILRSMYATDAMFDYIPVDICIKGIIVASWYEATLSKRSTPCQTAIYNSTGRDTYATTVAYFAKIGTQQIEKTPIASQIWYPNAATTTWRYWHYLNVILYQVLPAILVDGCLLIAKKKPMLLKLQRKIYVTLVAIELFLSNSWDFKNENFLSLNDHLLQEDRTDFYFQRRNVDVQEYFVSGIANGLKYILHQRDEDVPKNQRRQKLFKILNFSTMILFYGILLYAIYVRYMLAVPKP